METIVKRYRKQNTKGFKGIKKVLLEQKVIIKNWIKYFWYKYIIYNL